MEFMIKGGSEGANITLENKKESNGILSVDVKMVLERECIPEPFKVCFSIPDIDIYSTWSPGIQYDRGLNPSWRKKTTHSRLATWMPLHSLVSLGGKNRMTVAISDAKTPISLATGVREETACIDWDITFFTVNVAPIKEYTATIRIDTRDIPYYDSIYDVTSWWEKVCGYVPAHVPEYARLPMNSLWYSYHQSLDVEDILKECALSKPLGMDTVIIDDGWQTTDNSRGYAFCGDWETAPEKVGDMKGFVDAIHATGMKVILWYSLSLMGIHAKNYERFKDMMLDQTGNGRTYWALDPRYKEVRDYLAGIYTRAASEWGVDGFKFDFIDAFALRGRSLEYDERRDIHSLEDAIDTLMTDIISALKAINGEIMIEFRQTYVGPAIRKYGNMLRVGDCPNDAIINRQDIVNLRLTSGNTPVHSDMIMWNYDDTVESAALQFASILYSVPQISVKIARLCDDHKKMLKFYLSFWREHRDILIDGKLTAASPESSYSTVCAEKNGDAIFTTYTDTVVDCRGYVAVTVVNATRDDALIIKGMHKKEYRVLDCMGNTVGEGIVNGDICEISVPLAGMIFIK